MIDSLLKSKLAIIGGGGFCRVFIEFLLSGDFNGKHPEIIGVADVNPDAKGIVYAREKGIYTTSDYKDLFDIAGLEVLLELTHSNTLADLIYEAKPAAVRLVDHKTARTLWSLLKIEDEKNRTFGRLEEIRHDPDQTRHLFQEYADTLGEVVRARAERYTKVERDLGESEKALSQIVQGSTIPTFVINQHHIVTNWNRACERLTGYPADEIVGTNRHWEPFRIEKRPIMADLILDGVTEEEVWRYYGTRWRKSALIGGAYEAEEYFPHLGEDGKWLYFTAAPIKAADGTVVGAIETIWDRTPDKKAEAEREQHNAELAEKAEALRASERALAQIIEGSTVPTFVIDEQHVITHWNKAMEKLTDWPKDQMIGTTMQWAPFWDDERPTMADAVLSQMPEPEIQKLYGSIWRKSNLIEDAYEAEEYFPRLGENGKWCFFTAAPIRASDGRITGAIETLWDRTESKLAEEEKERYFNEISGLCSFYAALSTSLDLDRRIEAGIGEIKNFMSLEGICVFLKNLDGDLKLRYHSGVPKELCVKGAAMEADSLVFRAAQNGKLAIYNALPEEIIEEVRWLRREGLKSVAYVPITTKDRKPIGVVRLGSQYLNHFSSDEESILELIGNRLGVAIENSLLHEQYIRSEEKYRSLFNNDPNPIFIIDRESLNILDINHRAMDCYEYDRKALMRTSFLDLGDPKEDELAHRMRDLSEGQSVFFSKKRHYKKGGIPFYVNINVSYATYREMDVLIAATTDVTETVEKETQLIQASKMTTLGQMAAGIAHEINQPLNVIQVCADFFLKMMKRGEAIDDEDLLTLANDISDNVQRAADIIRHMRDFSRQSEVVKNNVDINDPIRDVFKVMGHQLKVHKVNVTLDLCEVIPPILAEHNRLEQVFINLVSNAVDAMDEQSRKTEDPEWEKRLFIQSSHGSGVVTIIVSDTGTGMNQQVLDKIFEPFFTTKEVGKGTGLGVSISYGIVKDFDGEIDIESEVGKGTTFKLTFPVQ